MSLWEQIIACLLGMCYLQKKRMVVRPFDLAFFFLLGSNNEDNCLFIEARWRKTKMVPRKICGDRSLTTAFFLEMLSRRTSSSLFPSSCQIHRIIIFSSFLPVRSQFKWTISEIYSLIIITKVVITPTDLFFSVAETFWF